MLDLYGFTLEDFLFSKSMPYLPSATGYSDVEQTPSSFEDIVLNIIKINQKMCNGIQRLQQELEKEVMAKNGKVNFECFLAIGRALMYTVLHPELLQYAEILARYGGDSSVNYQDSKTGETVLQNAISCANLQLSKLLLRNGADVNLKNEVTKNTALHIACQLVDSYHWICLLISHGANITEPNGEGQMPLHLCLQGDPNVHRKNMEDSVLVLLQHGADVNATDKEGESPLLYIRTFLSKGMYQAAVYFTILLLEHGSDPNIYNDQGRTLLTYSVTHLDNSAELSRYLLNSGAQVWKNTKDIDNSAFSWFLKAVINRGCVENCAETLNSLSCIMGQTPRKMHDHVMRTMFRHVRCFRILGPVFLQLKLSMVKYWTVPSNLKYLCWKSIRKSLGPKRIVQGTPQLGLPKSLQKYLLME